MKMTDILPWNPRHVWLPCLILSASFAVAKADDSFDSPKQVERLIRQLDADSFWDREKAHRRLVEIGKPAMSEIRKATNHQSAEVRHRAQAILRHFLSKELEGMWQSDDQVLIIKDNHWWWGQIDDLRPAEYDKSRFIVVEVSEKIAKADLWVGLGGRKGQTCKAIFRLDGDTLHYSGSYRSRPIRFKNGSGYEVEWKRVNNEPRSIDS
jgi:hypothetical protein